MSASTCRSLGNILEYIDLNEWPTGKRAEEAPTITYCESRMEGPESSPQLQILRTNLSQSVRWIERPVALCDGNVLPPRVDVEPTFPDEFRDRLVYQLHSDRIASRFLCQPPNSHV